MNTKMEETTELEGAVPLPAPGPSAARDGRCRAPQDACCSACPGAGRGAAPGTNLRVVARARQVLSGINHEYRMEETTELEGPRSRHKTSKAIRSPTRNTADYQRQAEK